MDLYRPIVFMDLETTGLKPLVDKIVEFSLIKIGIDGSQDIFTRRVNPEIEIPEAATAIHHISNDDVKDEPMFKAYAPMIVRFMDGCDIAGFNIIKFDLNFLKEELKKAGIVFSCQGRSIVDCMVIYHLKEPRNLSSAYSKYCGKQADNAHSAEEDALSTIEILDKMLDTYVDLPKDMGGLHKLCNKVPINAIDEDGNFILVDGKVICNFGKKHNGHELSYIKETDMPYLTWILRSAFSDSVKDVVEKGIFSDNSIADNSIVDNSIVEHTTQYKDGDL